MTKPIDVIDLEIDWTMAIADRMQSLVATYEILQTYGGAFLVTGTRLSLGQTYITNLYVESFLKLAAACIAIYAPSALTKEILGWELRPIASENYNSRVLYSRALEAIDSELLIALPPTNS